MVTEAFGPPATYLLSGPVFLAVSYFWVPDIFLAPTPEKLFDQDQNLIDRLRPQRTLVSNDMFEIF